MDRWQRGADLKESILFCLPMYVVECKIIILEKYCIKLFDNTDTE